MTEFKREIQGPDLGSIPGVRASRPSAKGQGLFQVVDTALELGLKAKGRSSAKKASEELRGESESAVDVEKAVSGAEGDYQYSKEHLLLEIGESPETEELHAAHLADIKKEKLDKVLTTQKRLQNAVSRGLITSTEAEARLSMLRNEVLSDPFVAMYQEEFDRKLYPTSKAGATFKATMAEKEAAAAKKGKLEGTEAYSKLKTEIKLKNNVSEATAEEIIKDNEDRARKKQDLEFRAQQLTYNNEDFAARGDVLTSEVSNSYAGVLLEVLAAGKEEGGGSTVEASRKAVIKMEAIHDNALKSLQAMRRNKEGTIVGKDATYDSTVAQLEKNFERYKMYVTKDFTNAQKLKDMLEEKTAKQEFDDHVSLSALNTYFGPLAAALFRSGNPILVEYLLDNVTGFNKTNMKFTYATSPILQALSEANNAEMLKHKSNAVDNVHVKGEAKDELTKSIYATVVLGKGGTKAVESLYDTQDPAKVDEILLNTPVNLRDYRNNKEWLHAIKSDETARRAGLKFIEGAAIRAKSIQAREAEIGATIARVRSGLAPRHLDPEPLPYGLPTSLKVSIAQREKTKDLPPRHQRPRRYSIDAGGTPLNDQFHSTLVNAYELGLAVEELWNEEFNSVDDWINSLFTPLNSQTPDLYNKHKPVVEEGFNE